MEWRLYALLRDLSLFQPSAGKWNWINHRSCSNSAKLYEQVGTYYVGAFLTRKAKCASLRRSWTGSGRRRRRTGSMRWSGVSTELLVDSPAQAWIDHHDGLAAAAHNASLVLVPNAPALPRHATVIANARKRAAIPGHSARQLSAWIRQPDATLANNGAFSRHGWLGNDWASSACRRIEHNIRVPISHAARKRRGFDADLQDYCRRQIDLPEARGRSIVICRGIASADFSRGNGILERGSRALTCVMRPAGFSGQSSKDKS